MDENELIRTLTRIETKLDRLVADSEDYERRIRFLEKVAYSALAVGVAGLGSGVWSLLGG